MGWGEEPRPLAVLPADLERAIRRDERDQIRAVLEGDDLRRAMRVLADRLTDLDRDERQQAARNIPPEVRRQIRQYLSPNLRNLVLLLASLVEPLDGPPDPSVARFDRLQGLGNSKPDLEEYRNLTRKGA